MIPGTAEDDEILSSLSSWEQRWRDRMEFLRARGYLLRPRYHPDWTPSWRGTGKHPLYFEDAIHLPAREHLIDATRVSDGTLVYIKRVRTGDQESQILQMLSPLSLPRQPGNHCVPLLEIFQDEDDEDISYMVMPFLRQIDEPPFETVFNVVDLVDQLLEGLVYIHERGVAHRDCAHYNLMMDASMLYPEGFHPVKTDFFPDGLTPLKDRYRGDTPVRYYYIDFGISSFIPPDVYPRLVVGDRGRDQEVPELSAETPYDPFKVDIFIIGNMLRHYFFEMYSNVHFLSPLIEAMTATDPAARPDASGASALWKDSRSRIGYVNWAWRLQPRDEPSFKRVVCDTVTLMSLPFWLLRRALTWTTRSSGRA